MAIVIKMIIFSIILEKISSRNMEGFKTFDDLLSKYEAIQKKPSYIIPAETG